MDLTKVYYDSGGCSGNILQIVKREPEWAANRIQEGESAIEELAAFRAASHQAYPADEITLGEILQCPRCQKTGKAKIFRR